MSREKRPLPPIAPGEVDRLETELKALFHAARGDWEGLSKEGVQRGRWLVARLCRYARQLEAELADLKASRAAPPPEASDPEAPHAE